MSEIQELTIENQYIYMSGNIFNFKIYKILLSDSNKPQNLDCQDTEAQENTTQSLDEEGILPYWVHLPV